MAQAPIFHSICVPIDISNFVIINFIKFIAIFIFIFNVVVIIAAITLTAIITVIVNINTIDFK